MGLEAQTSLWARPLARTQVRTLRDYQVAAIAAVDKAWETHQSVLLHMATGTGKTLIFAEIIKRFKGRVLILAHRDELISQTIDVVSEHTGERVGVEQGPFYSDRERIVVGSVQTVYRPKRYKRMLALGGFDLVVIDECHHWRAPTYNQALEAFTFCKILGVTATPDRGDGKALGTFIDVVAYKFDILDGIRQGYLAPIEGHAVHIEAIDLTRVRTVRGDLHTGELDERVCRAVEGIVKTTLDRWPDHKAIAFFPQKRSANLAAARFNLLRPGIAACVTDDTPTDERRDIIARCKRGEFQILCGVLIFTEGFDWPDCDLIINARPTKSRALYTQMIGRGTRTLPGVVDGLNTADARISAISCSSKPHCKVADFVGNSGLHSLISPIDVLGGDYSELVVKKAKELAKIEGPGDPIDQLERATLELKALAASVQASSVKHSVREFDPFSIFNSKMPSLEKFDTTPLSTPQAEFLAKATGLDRQKLGKMSKTSAGKLISTIQVRKRHRLATFRQLCRLKEFGLDKVNISAGAASRGMAYMAAEHWNRDNIDPQTLHKIVVGEEKPRRTHKLKEHHESSNHRRRTWP